MLFNDRLTIQDTCRLTDTTFPIKSYLTSSTFPEQDKDKLGTEMFVKVRSDNNIMLNGKLHLDNVKCYILRYDIEYPYYIIGICCSQNYPKYYGSILLINNTPVDSENNEVIAIYPVQNYSYYKAYTKNVYHDFSNIADGSNGQIVRCDQAEPAHAIIVEILEGGYIRFITSEEAICIIDEFKYKSDDECFKEEDIYDLIELLLGEYKLYGSD